MLLTVTGRPDGVASNGCVFENITLDADRTISNDAVDKGCAPLNVISADITIKDVTLLNGTATGLIVNAKH